MMGEEKEGVLIIEGHEREGEARGTDTGDTEAPCLLPLRQICRFRVAGCAWHRIADISQSWNAYIKENRRPPNRIFFVVKIAYSCVLFFVCVCPCVRVCVYMWDPYLPPRLSCAVARTWGMKILNGAAWSLALLSHHPFRDSRLAKRE